ncbi:hypothetical protein QYM36_011919 [Artemia franciscana]|uniref:Uncharacterized protein n=1 Tax=Artemia franciscana TaxID=6661 RepID=A0AA88HRL4_ARTSF|nr:hypothetical protein QYM36_011919 [Artemia franciscana]
MFSMYQQRRFRLQQQQAADHMEYLGHDRFNYKNPSINYDKPARKLRPKRTQAKVERDGQDDPIIIVTEPGSGSDGISEILTCMGPKCDEGVERSRSPSRQYVVRRSKSAFNRSTADDSNTIKNDAAGSRRNGSEEECKIRAISARAVHEYVEASGRYVVIEQLEDLGINFT